MKQVNVAESIERLQKQFAETEVLLADNWQDISSIRFAEVIEAQKALLQEAYELICEDVS